MRANQSVESGETGDVLIIGGGVIGLTIARALAKRGKRNVTVIEKNEFGHEASWAAGGILAPQVEADKDDDFLRLACASRDMYQDFVLALEEDSGIDVGLETTGTIFAAFTEIEEAEFRARYQWQHKQGLSIEWLAKEDVRRIEPNISGSVRCALRFPNDYQVENRRLVEALLIANKTSGVRLINDCDVRALKLEGGRAAGIESSRGFIPARVVVLAAGAWSSSIDSSTPLPHVDVQPVRGQMISFRPRAQLARHVIYSSRGYLIPRRDGRLLAGSTTEEAGFDKRVTEEGVNTIKSMAYEIAPVLKVCPVADSWAGFRPRAKDGLPALGPTKTIDGLFYATGHYRNGILLAPITGELIAEAIISKRTSPLLSAFSPDRFEA